MGKSLFQLVAEGVGHTIATRNGLFGRRASLKLQAQRIVSPSMATQLSLVTQKSPTPLQLAASELARSTYLDLRELNPA